MRASDLFPCKREYDYIRDTLKFWKGSITKVVDSDRNIVFDSGNSFEYHKEHSKTHKKGKINAYKDK